MAGNFAHMDTGAVSALMARLADAARDLDRGWQEVLPGIAGGEAAIGGDRIGRAITGAYQGDRTALADHAARVPRAMLADADVGERCADDYRAADARARAGFGGPDARA